MALLNTLSEKIEDLKKNSQEELNIINEKLDVINNALANLSNEDKLRDSDFSLAIKLVDSQSFGILDFRKIIQDVKNTLIAKYKYNQTFLTLSSDEVSALRSFKERLEYLKEELEKRKKKHEDSLVSEDAIETLEDFLNLLNNRGRRKYYTYDMIEAFLEVFDYDTLSLRDTEELVELLKTAKNFKGKLQTEKASIEEVKELFKEFLGRRYNEEYIINYADDICARIDIENARNIFEFFRRENILDKFNIIAIFQIVICANYEFVENFYREKVLSKPAEIQDFYYEDAMSGVWINEKRSYKHQNNKYHSNKEAKKTNNLFGTISDVTDSEVWENVRLLKENNDLLADEFDLTKINVLRIITKPNWLIKKNIDLLRVFNFRDVKVSALIMSDLEDKIHLVTEIGLLNSPRTPLFKEIERNIPKYEQFMINEKKKDEVNQSILDYYHRNTSQLGITSYVEYIYWFYKILNNGREEFLNSFFSMYRAGEHSSYEDFYTKGDQENLKNSKKIEEIVDDNFVINYYDALIDKYDEYSEEISEYNYLAKGNSIRPYFSEEILNDEVASRLREYEVYDELLVEGARQARLNEYVYMFDDILISRYKVLRNLSILKDLYGYINEDMLLTAIVNNSYLSKEQFDSIKEKIMKGSKTI